MRGGWRSVEDSNDYRMKPGKREREKEKGTERRTERERDREIESV